MLLNKSVKFVGNLVEVNKHRFNNQIDHETKYKIASINVVSNMALIVKWGTFNNYGYVNMDDLEKVEE